MKAPPSEASWHKERTLGLLAAVQGPLRDLSPGCPLGVPQSPPLGTPLGKMPPGSKIFPGANNYCPRLYTRLSEITAKFLNH